VDFAAWKQHQAVFEQPGKREFIFSVLPGSLDAALSSLGTTSSGWLLDLFFPCAAASGFEQPGTPVEPAFEQPGTPVEAAWELELIFSVLPGSRVDRLIEQPGSNFFLATWLLAACPESNTSSELQPRANTKEPPNLSVRGFIV
jgi:hypothetical protein